MQVSFGGSDIEMPQQFFNVFYISSLIKHVRCKTMPQTVYTYLFYPGVAFGMGICTLLCLARIEPETGDILKMIYVRGTDNGVS